jgi:hypothetical protein
MAYLASPWCYVFQWRFTVPSPVCRPCLTLRNTLQAVSALLLFWQIIDVNTILFRVLYQI